MPSLTRTGRLRRLIASLRLPLFLAATSAFLAGSVQAADSAPLHIQDRAYMIYGIEQDLGLIAVSDMAAQTTADPDIARIAAMVAEFHRGSDALMELATARGIEPLGEISGISRGTQDRIAALETSQTLDWAFLNGHAFTSYGAHYRYEREAIHGSDADIKAMAERAAGESRRQHWRALDIMNDWTWEASAAR